MDAAALLEASSCYVPSFFFDFTQGAIPAGATFTRGSGGTYFDANGVLQLAGNNAPRFDHDPVTLAPIGYLAEMQSTNSVAYSSGLTSSGWANNDTGGATVTANAQTSPDGTVNAATVQETTTSLTHGQSFSSVACVSGSSYGVSAFVKNIAGSRWFQMNVGGGSGINFNPTTGAIGSASSGITNAQALQLPNGWWRFSAQFVFGFTGSPSVRLLLVPAGTSSASQSYAGDGASTLAIWGVQFETAGVGVSSYIPTAGATATRAQDLLSLPLSSLPGWSASQGGILVAAYRLATLIPSVPGFNQVAAAIDDGSLNNRVTMYANNAGAGTTEGLMESGGVNIHTVGGTTSAVAVLRKQAVGWGVNLIQNAYDGALIGTTKTALALPVAPTTLNFGRSSGDALNGALKSVAFYPGARSDAVEQQVSR